MKWESTCLFKMLFFLIWYLGSSIFLFELMLQGIYFVSPDFFNRIATPVRMSREKTFENIFIKNYERNFQDPEYFAWATEPYMPHSIRGWAPKINFNGRQSTNNLGQRSLIPYSFKPEKFRIVAVGDSFTFGTEVEDGADWPAQLNNLDSRFQVVNLGVGGYGFDQMYLYLQEQISAIQPDIVVLAFVDDDLNRATSLFEGYKKPRFVVLNDDLVNIQGPIAGVKETYSELIKKHEIEQHKYRGLLSIYAGRNLFELFFRNFYFHKGDKENINYRLFKKISDLTSSHHSELMFVHFATGTALHDAGIISPGENFLRDYVRKGGSESVLFTRPAFLAKSGENWVSGHYSRKEDQVVAHLIQTQLYKSSAWQAWTERHQ